MPSSIEVPVVMLPPVLEGNHIYRSFPWEEFMLDHGVISLVGAGGKTTLMFSLARWMSARGKKVLTTTTTKIFMPGPGQTQAVMLSEMPALLLSEAERLLSAHGHITLGAAYLLESKKIKGLSPETVTYLWRSGIADCVIVEADGAAGRLLKAPAPHEPVIAPVTHCVIAVVGLAAIGKPFDDAHVFRLGPFAAITNLVPGQAVKPSSVADIILHHDGIMRGAPDEADKIVFLNKAGREDLQVTGEEVATLLQERGQKRLTGVFIGSASEDPTEWEWRDFRLSP